MRYSTQSQYLLGDSTSFGRIARITPGPRQIAAAGTRSANEAEIAARDESAALALRALSASGFGDAAIEHRGDFANLSTFALHRAAREDRARVIGQFVGALQSVVRRMREPLADLRRWREEQATYRALAVLDSRTLRDIGLDRSEARSLAREMADRHATRILALHSARHSA